MRATKLQMVYFAARDIPAMRSFYEKALALPLKFADGARWTQYDSGAASFALGAPDEAPDGAVGALPVFEVDTFDADRIRAAGGSIVAIRDMGSHGRVLTAKDPEGNFVQLFCRTTDNDRRPSKEEKEQ